MDVNEGDLMKTTRRLFLTLSILGTLFLGNSRCVQGVEAVAASVIAPIVLPIAKDLLGEIASGAKKGVISLSKKKNQCKFCNFGLKCKAGPFFSACKSNCTVFQQVGGYELRIRFGEGWSLDECVRKGVRAQLQTPQGKGDTKSIALYSQQDLDYLLELIALKMAAHKIVDTAGKSIKPDELKKLETTREVAVLEAKETIETITQSIDEAVKSGRFGNQ